MSQRMRKEPQTPRILHSPLSNRWYIATHYKVHATHIEATRKYEVTDQIAAIMRAADTEIASLREKVAQYEKGIASVKAWKPMDESSLVLRMSANKAYAMAWEEAKQEVLDALGIEPSHQEWEVENHG